MQTIKLKSDKIVLFSDIHWGKSRDSDIKLQIACEFIDNFCNLIKKHKIKNVIFLGDWFDNRSFVSVKTQNIAFDALMKISKIVDGIYMIVGNHDSYFKNTIAVNSVKTYSVIDNVYPIEELTEIKFKSGKKGLLCPWDSLDASAFKSKYDILFGHFELQDALLTGTVSKIGTKPSTLLSISPLVFSGHYHLRKKYSHKNGKIITIGSPTELDWGDADNEKGIYILDTKDLSYTFHKNTFSSKHIRIFWSKIKSKTSKFNQIKGNYVRLVIDTKYKFEHIMKVVNLINSNSPIKPAETDFIYNDNINMLSNFNIKDSEDTNIKTKLDYMKLFIDDLFDNVPDEVKDIDKDTLLKMTMNIYDETLNNEQLSTNNERSPFTQ